MKITIHLILAVFLTAALSAKSKEVLLGEKAYSRGSHDAAKKYFEQAIENGDETGDPRFYIGLILEARRQYAESIPYYRAAAERPMHKKFKKAAYWKIVILCRQAKLYGEALRAVERLEEMGEKSETFDKVRYEAENYQGRREYKGYDNIRKATALEKEFNERIANGDKPEDAVELIERIIASYRQAIAQDERWKDYRWKIAKYYEKLKRNREAGEAYRQIWEDGGDAGAAYKLGYFARRSGDYRGALKYFAAALEKEIEDPQLKFYLRYNAAQANYGLGKYPEAFTHAKAARRLAADLELRQKTTLGMKRVFCLSAASTGNDDEEYCKFSKKTESPMFLNLLGMKRALAAKSFEKAAGFAAKIYKDEAVEDDENGATLPAYAMSDLPVAIGVLFRTEKYRSVLDLTEKFKSTLEAQADYYGWRAVSRFALKEYGSAVIEFDRIKTLTPSQMNLHLIALAQMGDYAGVKAKGRLYLRNARARDKISTNLRKLRVFEQVRREPDFESWVSGNETQPVPVPKPQPQTTPAAPVTP